METTNINNIHFKGWDARPLKALIARKPVSPCGRSFSIYPQIIREMTNIGEKEGIDIFVQTADEITGACTKAHIESTKNNFPLGGKLVWAQDFLTFTPDRKLVTLERSGLRKFSEAVSNFFGVSLVENPTHTPGGNMYFIREGSQNSLIIGSNEYNRRGMKDLQQEFGVDRIYPITQPDYHIDLGIRPLKGKTILVEDQQMTLDLVREALQKAEKYVEGRPIEDDTARAWYILKNLPKDMEEASSEKFFKYRGNDKIVQEELERYGFNVVKVPATIRTVETYSREDILERRFNLLNAIVHERSDGSLVYITGSTNEADFGLTPEVIEKIGFSFEQKFKECIKDYVAPEDVHFIDTGDILRKKKGGIHCLFAEVPIE